MLSICLSYLIFIFREFKSIHKGKTAILHLRFGTEKIAVWVAKKPDIFGLFAGDIFFVSTLWRSRRDLNSRAGYPTYALSRGASSPT